MKMRIAPKINGSTLAAKPTNLTSPIPTRTDPRDIFLKGPTLYLKALNESDVLESNWYGWFNDADTTHLMQQHYYPNTREDQLEFLRTSIRGVKNKLQLGICPIESGTLIGIISLNDIDFLNRKADFSAIIGEKSSRNVKYYIEATELLIRHAFDSLNLRRIYGGTIIKENAVLLCRTLGFKDEGVARADVFKNGRYYDVYRIGLLAEEFKPSK